MIMIMKNVTELSFDELLCRRDVLEMEHSEWADETWSESSYEATMRDKKWSDLQVVQSEIERQLKEEEENEPA